MADKDVTITISGRTISASPDSVTVKQNNEKVKWSCTADSSVTGISIDFDNDGTWDVTLRQTGNSWSGTSKEFPTMGTFKYNITVDFGGTQEVLDPDIVVVRGP